MKSRHTVSTFRALILAMALVPNLAWGQIAQSTTQEVLTHGLALIKEKHIDEAIQVFQAGLNSEPENPSLLNAMGAAYSLKNEPAKAQSYFLHCLAVDPEFIPARKNLGISYFNAGEYDLSAVEFTKFLAAHGEPRETAEIFLGMIHEKKKEYAASAAALQPMGELLYRYPEAMLSLAESYYALHEAAKANAVLVHLNTVRGATDAQLFRAGLIYAQYGKYERALPEFDRVARVSPSFSGLAYQRAFALDQLGRSQEALKQLEASTKENPDADSLNLLAKVAEENHETALAFQSLRRAAKLAPEKEENYLDFSTLCLDHRNYPLALQAVDIGLANVPASYRLQVQKGAILEKLSRFDEAEDTLRKAIQLQPADSAAQLSLGIVQAHAGKLDEAAATLEAATLKFSNEYYVHYFLGKILIQIASRNGTPEEADQKAEAEFKESIRLNPSYADAYYQLARLNMKAHPALAEQNLVECLKKDPTHASAEYTLGRLYMKMGRSREGQELLAKFERDKKTSKEMEDENPTVKALPE
jgi:tetratricopeptide (TPR) repeat protein